jgi:hypothetical protein
MLVQQQRNHRPPALRVCFKVREQLPCWCHHAAALAWQHQQLVLLVILAACSCWCGVIDVHGVATSRVDTA